MSDKKVTGGEVCELCGAALAVGRNGIAAYKSLPVLRGAGQPPVSVKACRACWEKAMRPGGREASLPAATKGAAA